MDIAEFKRLPLMGILRGITPDMIDPIVNTVISSGLKTIEITMNTVNAPKLIHDMSRASGDRLNIGAGTVLTTDGR